MRIKPPLPEILVFGFSTNLLYTTGKIKVGKIEKKKKKCPHNSFYRYWYNEDHLINHCRKCQEEWSETYRPFLLGEYPELTSGVFEETKSDKEEAKKHQTEINELEDLLFKIQKL